ncbi:MAG TPA: hypothetical protein VIP46_09185 [Pyrinomonadaceae bacterium]
MTRDLSAFTRLTLLISDLRGNSLSDLSDTKKCDLAHHAAKLETEFAGTPHDQIARRVGHQSRELLSRISGGAAAAEAEEARAELLASCKSLKDLI